MGGRAFLRTMVKFLCRLMVMLAFASLGLCLEDANAGSMIIFTRNLTPLGSRIATLDVDGVDSVEFVKGKNQEAFGYLPQDQYLFYSGNFMSNGRVLFDYGVQNESVINMAVIDSFDGLSFAGFLPGSNGFSPFMMRNATSGAGDGWAAFNYTNTVDLSATGTGEYLLSLFTVTPGVSDAPGEMPGFDGQQAYEWTFLTATGGIVGFSPDQFLIETGQFANTFTGSFSVVQQGNSLALSYVPEPSTCIMALAGIACGGFSMWRRRKRA